MNKLIAGILASFLVVAGFVATAGTSTAAPYTGTIGTSTFAEGPSRVAKGAQAVYQVTTNAQDTEQAEGRSISGKLVITIRKKSGGFATSKIVYGYDGSASVKTPSLPTKGRYFVNFQFQPKANSAFIGSSVSKTVVAR